jgi:hypothetical protein
MPEEDVRAIGCGARLGMDEVISGADEKAEVGCSSFELALLFGGLEALHQVDERVGNPAGRAVLQTVDASTFNSLAAPDGVPLQACKAVDSKSERPRVIRMNCYCEAFVVHGDL